MNRRAFLVSSPAGAISRDAEIGAGDLTNSLSFVLGDVAGWLRAWPIQISPE